MNHSFSKNLLYKTIFKIFTTNLLLVLIKLKSISFYFSSLNLNFYEDFCMEQYEIDQDKTIKIGIR